MHSISSVLLAASSNHVDLTMQVTGNHKKVNIPIGPEACIN